MEQLVDSRQFIVVQAWDEWKDGDGGEVQILPISPEKLGVAIHTKLPE
jgi:hypothetical protein